jgi:pilus assembly protein CpaC
MKKQFVLLSFFSLFSPLIWARENISVEVKVEVTEIDQNKAVNLGVDWVEGLQFGKGSPHPISSLGTFGRISDIQADIHFLIQNGAAELLATPNLITDSGTLAFFHAGGEIPYITNATLGSTHVEFKSYGVNLKVEPTVLEDGLIKMNVEASVSAPDQTSGVLLSGNQVPGLFEREVATHVTLESGRTMTLAGLVQTHKEDTIRAVPFLNKIPVLGLLFKYKQTRFRRTTIVIFVTPNVVDL